MTPKTGNRTLTETEKSFLCEVKKAIRVHLPQADVYLYGSAARGENTPDSDYDIIVLTEEPLSWRQQDEVRRDVFTIEIECDVVICLLFKSKEEWNSPFMRVSPFCKAVEQDKIRL